MTGGADMEIRAQGIPLWNREVPTSGPNRATSALHSPGCMQKARRIKAQEAARRG